MVNVIKGAADALLHGSWSTRLSALFWGAAWFGRRQWLRGLLRCAEQALFLAGILLTLPYMGKLPTLGTVQAERIWDPVARQNVWNDYDNSFLILLFGVVGVVLLIFGTVQWLRNLRDARELDKGHFRTGVISDALGGGFHRTVLALPVAGVAAVVVIPLIVMVLIAFTNYDRNHLVPTNLFTWVGLDNFAALLGMTSGGAFGYAFRRVLVWTIVWAVLSTLSCYIGGVGLAMLVGSKLTIGKRFWRTCFMLAMAVPQFVSLLLVRNLFADVGLVNTLCRQWGVTEWLYEMGAIPTANVIPFLTHPDWARPMILLINLWVGVPYQLLVATGILINIPEDMKEAARIDGASNAQVFRHVTLPYLLHITAPSLVSGMVANINNFNVIWLLTRDVYVTTDQTMAAAGATEVDLLVTWLYRLTQDQSNYKMASVIGILVFLVCSAVTLLAFGRMTQEGKEAAFQ